MQGRSLSPSAAACRALQMVFAFPHPFLISQGENLECVEELGDLEKDALYLLR